jgi:hypothetical protein
MKLVFMGKTHDKLLKIYRVPENLESILNEPIIEVITEKRMADIFERCYSPLTPDIIAVPEQENYIWIGELKGNNNIPCMNKAHRQIARYLHEAERYHIDAKGFIIVGNYVEIMEGRECTGAQLRQISRG